MQLIFNSSTTRVAFFALIPLLTFLTFEPRLVHAEPLNPAHVPEDAQWLIHVDYESLSESEIWRKVRSEKPGVSQMAQGWMKKRYGIDPPEDLKSVTMFSRDYREYTGTVIIQADYQPDKIEAVLRKAIDHRKTQWQDYTLHTITLSKQKPSDDGPSGDEEMTVVMVDEKTILLASSVPNAKECLKLLAGESPSLDSKRSPLLTDAASDAWLYGAAINLVQLKNHPIAMPILAQHQHLNWSFGEQSDGSLYEQANLVAETESVAKKMEMFLDGIVAYEMLWADGSEPMEALLDNVHVKRDGVNVGFQWQGPSDQVIAALDDVFARLGTWKPIWMKAKR